VELGGNYGRSYARILAESNPAYMVLEISSFQLDDIETFSPHVGILLNITPDHLDRYEYKMSNYVASKFRITMNQDAHDYLIYNADDIEIIDAMNSRQGQARLIAISAIKGRHNLFNAKCAVEACRIIGMSEDEIGKGLASFVNLPHRLEPCGTIDGVSYINDSKATNVDSVYYALDAMKTPVIWIAGGTDKGNNYEPLVPLMSERVRMLICLGVDNQKLKEFFAPYIPMIVESTSVEEVVKIAQGYANEGDTVLLSPACASFDLFKNYMDRGDQFKAEVLNLKSKKSNQNKALNI
jgi:UDP-N-acetylmuramoylalanine--D-glutamate ligase